MTSPEGSALPLSAAQHEIWTAEQQLGTPNRVFGIGQYSEVFGPVDPVLFETVLRHVVERTDVLCVRFVEETDGPRQIVMPVSDWPMPVKLGPERFNSLWKYLRYVAGRSAAFVEVNFLGPMPPTAIFEAVRRQLGLGGRTPSARECT